MKKTIRLTENQLIGVIKKVINESQELNELGGITMNSRAWSDILVSKIKESYGKDFTINGKDFPEAYENFSVDTFNINFKPIGAYAYDQDNSGFVGDDYVVTLIVDPTKLYKIDVSIINHEMKHAYQDYKRYVNKSIGIKDSNFIKNMYTDDFSKFVVMFFNGRGQDDTLMKILYLYYILSNVEQTAFLENIYDEGPNPNFFGYTVQVKSAMNLLNQLDITNLNERTWQELTRADIPFIKKFKSKEEFAKYSEKYLKKLAENFRKKINKMKYLNFPK